MVVSRSHTTINRHRRAIGTFPNRRIATQALHELRDSGFPMERVSIITRHRDRKGKLADIAHETKADEGASLGAAAGSALGTLTGLLVGLGTLAIPGIGPVMLAGATATTIATTIAGTDSEIAQAEYIFQRRGIAAYRVYDIPTSSNAGTVAPKATPVIQHNSVQPSWMSPRSVQQYDTVDVGRSKHGIAVFPDERTTGGAIAALNQVGFPLTNLSVITRQVEYPEAFVGVDLRERFETARYGVPVDHAQQYDEQLDKGACLVIVSGGEQEIQYTAEALATRGAAFWQVYDPMLINPTATSVGEPMAVRPQPVVETAKPTRTAQPAPPPVEIPAEVPPAGVNHTPVRSQRIIPTVEVIQTTTLQPTPMPAPIVLPPISSPMEATQTPAAKPAPPPPPTGMVAPPIVTQPQHYRALGILSQRQGLETALSELRSTGFPMEQVSLLIRETPSPPGAGADSPPKKTRASRSTRPRSAAPSLDTLMIGIGTLTIPGVGSVIAGGATAMAIAAILVSTSTIGNGAESLVKALMQEGIPEHFARAYGDRFHQGDALIMVDGSEANLLRAGAVMEKHHIHAWEMFNLGNAPTNPTAHPGVNSEGLRPEYHQSPNQERLGVEQRTPSGLGIDGSQLSWKESGDRPRAVYS